MSDNETNKAEPSSGDKSQDKLSQLEQELSSRSAVADGQKKPEVMSDKPLRVPVWLSLISVVAFLMVFVLAAGGGWFWYQWQQQQASQTTFIENQRSALESQQQANETFSKRLQEQVDSLLSDASSIDQKLQSNSAGLDSVRRELADVSGRRPSDWLLAEADYLVRMAGRKLWLEHDVRTAILMLQSADSRLESMDDPSLIPIRELIASDIQVLRQLNPVSLPSVALAVSGMVKQVNQLAIALPEIPEVTDTSDQVTESVSDWRSNLSQVWRYVTEELVNYQPRTQPIRPLLTQQQQWLVREQLKLSLLQAQSAVLQQQDTLFEQSLQSAIGQLVEHFDLTHEATNQFLASLNNLAQTNIKREYPDSLASSAPLETALDRRLNRIISTEGTPL